jgi:hypothetical protein
MVAAAVCRFSYAIRARVIEATDSWHAESYADDAYPTSCGDAEEPRELFHGPRHPLSASRADDVVCDVEA